MIFKIVLENVIHLHTHSNDQKVWTYFKSLTHVKWAHILCINNYLIFLDDKKYTRYRTKSHQI